MLTIDNNLIMEYYDQGPHRSRTVILTKTCRSILYSALAVLLVTFLIVEHVGEILIFIMNKPDITTAERMLSNMTELAEQQLPGAINMSR